MISCFGSLASLYALRRREPDLNRPYRAIAYPLFPALALCLAVVCLVTMLYYNAMLSGLYLVMMGIFYFYYHFTRDQRVHEEAPSLASLQGD